jgi:hypothetical protein
MPRPIQPSAFSYLLPTLVQSGDNSQSSGASGWTPGGALSLQIPDNTVIGGNPRGLGAVDLQTQRTAATQVASGAGSFVAGVNNTASGAQATAFGSGNTASGTQSFASGATCTASGNNSGVFGSSCTASGAQSFATGSSSVASGAGAVAMGPSNTAGGSGAAAIGHTNNVTGTESAAVGRNNTVSSSYAHAYGRDNSIAPGSGYLNGTCVGEGNSHTGQAGYLFGKGNSCSTGSSLSVTAFGVSNSVSNGSPCGAYGASNTVNVNNGFAFGSGNTVSAAGIAVGTRTSTVNAANSTVVGGTRGTTRSIVGNIVIPGADPISATLGITQTARLILARETTDATPTALASNTSAAGSTNQVILPDNSAYLFTANIIACQTAGAAAAGWKVDGVIRRGANAASTTLVNTATTVIDNTPGWAIALTADTTNGGLTVTVTGASATTIRWVCSIDTVEVTF